MLTANISELGLLSLNTPETRAVLGQARRRAVQAYYEAHQADGADEIEKLLRETRFTSLEGWRDAHLVADDDLDRRQVEDDLAVAVALGEYTDVSVVYCAVRPTERHLHFDELEEPTALCASTTEKIARLLLSADSEDGPAETSDASSFSCHCDLWLPEVPDCSQAVNARSSTRKVATVKTSYDTLKDAKKVCVFTERTIPRIDKTYTEIAPCYRP